MAADDRDLAAILIREVIRRVEPDLIVDQVALKEHLAEVLADSEVRIILESTRPQRAKVPA